MRLVETLLLMLCGVHDAIATPEPPPKKGDFGKGKLHLDVTRFQRNRSSRVERNPIRTWVVEKTIGWIIPPLASPQAKQKRPFLFPIGRSRLGVAIIAIARAAVRRGEGELGTKTLQDFHTTTIRRSL